MSDARRRTAIRVGSTVYRPLFDATLSAEDRRKAREELNESPDPLDTARELDLMRQKLDEDDQLSYRVDDEFLIRFLRVRKHHVDRSVQLVRDHYRFREKHPLLFRTPRQMEPLLSKGIFDYLPHRDAKGRGVFVMKIGHWRTEEFSFKDFVCAGSLLSELVLAGNPVTQVNGFVGIWDFKDYTLSHFTHSATPRLMWMLCCLMQDCFPGRFKMAFCVNCLPLSDTVWRLFKPLIREKFRKRLLVVGSNMSLLHRYIPPNVLPEEYGGHGPPSDHTLILERALENDSAFESDRKYGFAPARGCKDEKAIRPQEQKQCCT